MQKLRFLTALTIGAITTACGSSSAPPTSATTSATQPVEVEIQQERLCEVDGWQHDVAKRECVPGQKIVFLPGRWGNEQQPILFAAVNCDMRYSIALTNGGVTCIYAPIEVAPTEPSVPPPVEPEAPAEK